MKAELRFAQHTKLRDQAVVEVWYDGEFIAQITGGDGPAIRVMSKFPMHAVAMTLSTPPLPIAEKYKTLTTYVVETRVEP